MTPPCTADAINRCGLILILKGIICRGRLRARGPHRKMLTTSVWTACQATVTDAILPIDSTARVPMQA
jgi:hypothetical protein